MCRICDDRTTFMMLRHEASMFHARLQTSAASSEMSLERNSHLLLKLFVKHEWVVLKYFILQLDARACSMHAELTAKRISGAAFEKKARGNAAVI